jgi:hypothetical protein
MCCFSPVSAPVGLLARLFSSLHTPTVHVADTSIFARFTGITTQALVYSMELSVAGDVAMILPLPVRPGSGEDGATFVSLADHAKFFDNMRSLFTMPMPAQARSAKGGFHLPLPEPRLKVHEVGSFEASFVPTMRDFGRLDERFRLPDSVWRGLGMYEDWGFAVFRLKAGRKKHIHPMALRFETRDRERIFFPTVHVHDGQVHADARFDHELYYQRASATGAHASDMRAFMQPASDALGLVAKDASVFRRELRGRLPNQDTWIER